MNTVLRKNNSRRKTYLKIYTLLFSVMVFFVFCWYFFTDKNLLYNDDGWMQHYKALMYYSQYLRTIAKTLLLEHKFTFPEWDIRIGQGADILETFHYYVIGDPFTLCSVLIPVKYLHYYAEFTIILRMYLSGLAFSGMAYYLGIKDHASLLAGSQAYVFCYWSIYVAARHPYFLNPCLFLPLLIWGVEKILRKESSLLFTLTVMISALSNFYFFYMLVLLTIVYVLIRLFSLYHTKIRKGLHVLVKIAGSSCLGCLLASVILLPMLGAFLSSSRISAQNSFHLLYPLGYYSKLPGLFLSEGDSYWLCMGYTAPVLPAVFLLFLKKGRNTLKILFAIGIVFILFPCFGQIFNGFSYKCNRWCFAFALLCSYILSANWRDLFTISRKDLMKTVIFLWTYFLLCLFLEKSRMMPVFAQLVLVVFLLLLLLTDPEYLPMKKKQYLAFVLLFVSILTNSFFKFSTAGDGYVTTGVDNAQFLRVKGNETKAIQKVTKDSSSFVRYSGDRLTHNADILSSYSSTEFYWTISPPSVTAFRKELEISEGNDFCYSNYKNRAALLAFSSVKYFTAPSGSTAIPYGFELLGSYDVNEKYRASGESEKRYDVYENKNTLPLGYTYSSVMQKEQWDEYSSVEKQELLLKTAVLDSEDLSSEVSETFSDAPVPLDTELLSCDIDDSTEVTYQEGCFIVTKENASVTLHFTGLDHSETYLLLKNLNYTPVSEYDLYFGDDSVDPKQLYNKKEFNLKSLKERQKIRQTKLFWDPPKSTTLSFQTEQGLSQSFEYQTPDNSYYGNRHDFTAHLGYTENAVSSVTLSFSGRGIYTFDSLSAACYPMTQFESLIEERKSICLTDVSVKGDWISGTITCEEPKLLCITVPYSKGWTAYDHGEKIPLLKMNSMYLGMTIQPGEHQIQLVYHSPYLRIGLLFSGIGLLILVSSSVFGRGARRL